ncbi:hypothetical protein SMY44_000685 [Cronobacter sakazakii]|nr:hypothetical protein [Cronobacter sakazakii]ELY4028415.1 hypothetical protein [Cronobacter sakazakii]
MDKSREQFLEWFSKEYEEVNNSTELSAQVIMMIASAAWQASRAAMTPACWLTYYPDTDEEAGRAHSESGPESCAKRIASEIGGYVVPVYYGEPQQCAAGIKVKGE